MSNHAIARGFFKTAIPIALPMLGKALASPFGQMAASAAIGKMQSVPTPPKTPPPIKPANPMSTPGRF